MPMDVKRSPQVRYDHVKFRGGLDLVTPTLDLPAGVVRDSQNFEVSTTGGYTRIAGYERFDGRPAPSAATYKIMQFTSFTNTPIVGDVVDDSLLPSPVSTATVIAVGVNYLVATKVTGTFATGVIVEKVGTATAIGTIIAQTVVISPLLDAQYKFAAAELYKTDILVPVGSGAIRGVATLIVGGVDKTYAFRNNAGGTAVDVWVASATGWTAVALMEEISYNTGAAFTPVDGAILTQGGVTATVKRIMIQTGTTFIGSTGRFIINGRGGGNFAAGAATLTGGATCTLVAIQTAITISPNGKFEFVTGNFFGQTGTLRLYGCDGVNRMFEFDGTTLAPITTGTVPDTPKHLIIHNKYLVGAFLSSVIMSGTATPYSWTSANGSLELATGDEITGFVELPAGASGTSVSPTLGVYGTRTTSIIYGTDKANWTVNVYNQGSGGLHYTAQLMGEAYVLDDPGVVTIRTVQEFGNFAQATLTANILPFITTARLLVANSSLSRPKSQYRLFFTDNSALYLTIVNKKYVGAMVQRFPQTVYSTSNSDATRVNGDPDTFFGSNDGFVMQLDKGTSFDGAAIDAYADLNWNVMKSPRMSKSYRKAALEVQGTGYAQISFGYALGYNSTKISQPVTALYDVGTTLTTSWDAASMIWDIFTWDGGTSTLIPTELELRGTSESIKARLSSGTAYIPPYTLNSLLIHYTMRRGVR